MNTLLKNPDELNISHDKFIHYENGTFKSLRGGCTGYGSKELYNKTPNALGTTIYCKQNDKELFYALKESIENLQSDDVKICITDPTPVKKIISLKSEYEKEVEKINQQNQEIDAKFNSLCDQLFDLGCDRIEGGPNHIEIPIEYYNTKDKYYYNSTPFTIYCTNESELYKQLSQ